ncbi:MAG: DUF6166 domain-containing protein [Pirellulales bacterium]
MKIYEGGRHLEGASVTVDGRALDPRFDLRTFSPAGFEWTYEGEGPRQLALAILADHFADDQKALSHCENFMIGVVANLDNYWQLTSADIDKALAGQGYPR